MSMQRLDGVDDPFTPLSDEEHFPISPMQSPAWRGVRVAVATRMFLANTNEALDRTIEWKSDKKQCFVCGRGSHLQVIVSRTYKYRKCRRHLTEAERGAFERFLH